MYRSAGVEKQTQYPLVFFYKGAKLPSYARASLLRAAAAWQGPVIMLGNQEIDLRIDSVHYENFSEWYDPARFESFKASSPLDESFRSGFWFHATERFFVLEQWSSRYEIQRFAHAELDVDVRCSQTVGARLDEWGKGLFYPFGTFEHAGASFFYTNSPASLSLLVQHLEDNTNSSDEMHALWEFGISQPTQIHVLPSHTVFDEPHPDVGGLSLVPASHVGGLFDVQPFGTWILGQDPRNAPMDPVFNHFLFEEIAPPSMHHLRFSMSPVQDKLWVKSEGTEKVEILTLHVHSKRFGMVRNRIALLWAVFVSRFPFRTPLGSKNLVRYGSRRWKKPIDLIYRMLIKGQRQKTG